MKNGNLKSKTVNELEVSYKKSRGTKTTVTITSAKETVDIMRGYYQKDMEIREVLYAIYLNQRNEILGIWEASRGGGTGTVVDLKLIMATALKITAKGMILMHNHPSGNLKASVEDIKNTESIKKVAEFHDINLLDHIIITEESFTSMTEENLI